MSADCHDYDDIIERPHPVSRRHPPMSMAKRAAQFSPFAALTGYEDAVEESARLTDSRLQLGEDAEAALAAQLARLPAACAAGVPVSITYFVPDARKEGGAYVTMTDTPRRIDDEQHCLQLKSGKTIPLGDIYALEYPPQVQKD